MHNDSTGASNEPRTPARADVKRLAKEFHEAHMETAALDAWRPYANGATRSDQVYFLSGFRAGYEAALKANGDVED